ncbi:APC family permease [Haladaptatus halobius]|uniref:APC family permease n=1 Tax=Haladaptatus halobius TaxID=2884875 RepID=UPI001D0B85DB|nr:APC family permease [Haladaptatus halobius]
MAELGLKEAVAMALGGMIGGGIFSAFGIIVAVSGVLAWAAFLLGSILGFSAAYSYIHLNKFTDKQGGAPTYIHEMIGNRTLAGMTGWTLLFGYIGSIALYAYAFASFGSFMLGRLHFLQIPISNILSVFLIGAFVGLNLIGVSETGKAEDILVVFKVGVIAVFGIWGVYYAYTQELLTFGWKALALNPIVGSTKPFLGAAFSIVTFQGWQLLMYDQDKFDNPEETIRKATYIAIPATTLLYGLVSLVTVGLLELPEIAVAPEVSLLYAALPYMGWIGAVAIAISALVSTASAVNATLFSSALFSRTLIDMDLLPSWLESSSDDGDGDSIPSGIVIILGLLSASFAVYGSLRSISSFSSLAFIVVFGAMSYLAYTNRDELDLIAPIPLLGIIAAVVYAPLLLYDLYLSDPITLGMVFLIAIVIIGSELLYFEGEPIAEKIRNS